MQDIKITLSIIWIAVMLTYLLGDVIRIFSGDVTLGEIQGAKFTQGMGLAIAVLSLTLPHNINRWANIIVAAFWFLFNLVGLPTYRGHYDKFLLAVSMVFNLVTIWYAWNWM